MIGPMIEQKSKEDAFKIMAQKIQQLTAERDNFQNHCITANAKVAGLEQAVHNLCNDARQSSAQLTSQESTIEAQAAEIKKLQEELFALKDPTLPAPAVIEACHIEPCLLPEEPKRKKV